MSRKEKSTMASIFKLGKSKRNKKAPWQIEYVDHTGKKRRKKGFTDKSLTMQLAAKLENEVRLRVEGLVDLDQERIAARRRTPLPVHLDDFEKSIGRKDSTGDHVKNTMSRIRRIVNDAGMECIDDIEILRALKKCFTRCSTLEKLAIELIITTFKPLTHSAAGWSHNGCCQILCPAWFG